MTMKFVWECKTEVGSCGPRAKCGPANS